MIEDKLLRIGLVTSLAINALAISLIGYAGTFKPSPAVKPMVTKSQPSRLIEISMLADEKASGKASAEKGGSDSGSGTGGDPSGSLSDSSSGPLGKLNQGHLANASAPPAEKERRKLAAKLHRAIAARRKSEQKKVGVKRNIKVAIRATQNLKLGTIRLKPPGRLITGGYHGIVDLRKLKLTAHLLAVIQKAGGKIVPNKYIGKQHIKVIGKTSGGAICIPTGGHTIYGSDLTIYLGKDVKLDGTKFCVPGGFPGIPGNAGQTNPTGTIRTLTASQSGGGGQGSDQHLYAGGDLVTHRPQHETEGGSSLENSAADPSGRGGGSKAGKGNSRHDPDGGTGASDYHDSQGSRTALRDDTDTASQQALQDRYEKYATGPLRGVDDVPGMDPSGGGVTRGLHLPASHNDPTDRIPGAWVPQDQRRLVDSPKAHRGSSAPKGAPEGVDPKQKHFDLTPASVGSHSSQGTIVWPSDAAKAHKHKASRRVKGDGKKDGGGDGSGLLGEYFQGMDFEKEVFRRPDRNIDFDWSNGPVDQRMPISKNFSVRWTGQIRPRYSETYTIFTASDDGERVWIDGRLLVSNWTTHGPAEDVGIIPLVAGRKYSIKVEYFENDVPPAVMKLYWQSPHQMKEYIPQSCLFYPAPRG